MEGNITAFVIFALAVMALLFYASWYDLKHKKIEYWLITVVILLGIIYALLWTNLIETIAVLVFIGFIFGTATLFTFGFGDFLLLMGLGCFIDTIGNLYLFLGLLLFWWALTTVGFIHTKVIKEKLSWKDSKLYFTEYPLVFVITISFISWVALVVIS